MTPPPRRSARSRAARSLDEALGQALEDLERGLSPLQILDRYPEYEEELAPLLETAYELRTTRWPILSIAARVSGRERMHAALAEHKARRGFVVAPIWRQLGAGLGLVLLAVMTYFASPVSPFRGMSRPRAIATVDVTPTATWTATWTVQPSPTNTTLPSATPTATGMVRCTRARTGEANRLKDLWCETAAAPTATGTPPPGGPIPTRTLTPTPIPPVTSEPGEREVQPPLPAPTATIARGAPPTASAKQLLPDPTRTPKDSKALESSKPTHTRRPIQTDEPTKEPAAASSSSMVQTVMAEQKPIPSGVKANGHGPAHERHDDAAKESRKAEKPREKDHKP